MDPLDEIEAAFQRIEEAAVAYRALLRQHIDDKTVTQAAVGRRLGRAEESLRQDRMTEQERAETRARSAERQAAIRAKARRGSAPIDVSDPTH